MSRTKGLSFAFGVIVLVQAQVAAANGLGENGAWQFQTAQDKANLAAIEAMRQTRISGGYAAPIYTTNIGKQFNCAVSAQATGNQGTSTAVGNSPSSSGNSSSSTGNSSSSTLGLGTGSSTASLTGTQQNPGEVSASSSGSVGTSVEGNSYQALNTTQTNSGTQSSSVASSNACAFGVLN